MINILKSTELGLETINEFAAGSWVNVIDPSPAEITQLHEALCVPLDFLTYPLDIDERPRTEKDEGVSLILLRIPYYQGETSDVPYATIPLGIILTDKLIITICRMKNDVTLELLNGRVKGLSTNKKNRLILQLLMSTALKYLRYLREINKTVDALEDELQLSIRNKEVLGLLKFEKSLVYFTHRSALE
jgi:magnesium transporter